MMERLATWECQRQLRYFYVSNMRIFALTAMDYSLSINNLINYILITAALHCCSLSRKEVLSRSTVRVRLIKSCRSLELTTH